MRTALGFATCLSKKALGYVVLPIRGVPLTTFDTPFSYDNLLWLIALKIRKTKL